MRRFLMGLGLIRFCGGCWYGSHLDLHSCSKAGRGFYRAR